jgi:hypothetical protein
MKRAFVQRAGWSAAEVSFERDVGTGSGWDFLASITAEKSVSDVA